MEFPPPTTKPSTEALGHRRWRSLDAVPEKDSMSWLQNVPGMTAKPQVVAEVAKIFSRKVIFRLHFLASPLAGN